MSDIEEMVRELIEAGTPAELAASVVARSFVAGSRATPYRTNPVDSPLDPVTEKRRAYDRERKAAERAAKKSAEQSAGSPQDYPVDDPPTGVARVDSIITTSSLDTDSAREEKQERNARGRTSPPDWPPNAWDLFYARYPHKVGKEAARKAFDSLRRSARAPPWSTLVGGLDRYIATKPPDRAWCNPATWLNQHRWDDQPGAVTDGKGPHPRDGKSGASAFLSGFAEVASGIAGDGEVARPPGEEIPRGRFEIDG